METLVQTVQFDADLLQKYHQAIPPYTSYPPATELSDNFEAYQFRWDLAQGNTNLTPLSLYFHIPFCQSACYFCGCDVIVTQLKDQVVEPYLKYLSKHIQQISPLIHPSRPVTQVHWGGGTPNYLEPEHLEKLWKIISQRFTIDKKAELSIEINPRYVDRNYILFLRQLGFNRISFGIQDFHPQVQAAIHRIQSEKMLFNVMSWIREAGFQSVNVDLIYGLPYQTLTTFSETIQKTLQLNPDRIAVFNFAYVPWLKPIQKWISPEALPGTLEKLNILRMTLEELQQAGYQFIGMDHFAKPNDELAVAQQQGRLHRNFQGYSTQQNVEVMGFGMSSMSMLRDVYIQNYKRLKDYYHAIDEHQLPIETGVRLHRDDMIRRHIIMELMCHFQLSKPAIEQKYNLDFDEYFDLEKTDLTRLQADGLLKIYADSIQVMPVGRLLIRNIAAVFDAYLRNRTLANFSRAI
jgi:oxygen-independent coproporphyrinogen-3 oxidase